MDSARGPQHPSEDSARRIMHTSSSVADQFRFGKALELVEGVRSNANFNLLSQPMQGRVWSSIGEYHAMLEHHSDAAAAFGWALKLFDSAVYDDAIRQRDKDQTMFYRAINSMDWKSADAQTNIEELLRYPLPEAAERAAVDTEGREPYHHHLIVRALALQSLRLTQLDPALVHEATRRYLAGRPHWSDGRQHPWGLINLYRAMLLWPTERDEAVRCWRRGVDVAGDAKLGPTLTLIAGLIGAVAWFFTQDDSFREPAARHLIFAKASLPAADDAIERIENIIHDPTDWGTRDALPALPFVYH